MPELRTALDLFERIGADRYLDVREVSAGDSPFVSRAWLVYESEFGCYTGATSDAAFRRLDHPALQTGRPTTQADTPVLVVGTGPSLAAGAEALCRLRGELAIVTSLRGARALWDLGIIPDLVLLSEASPLEATLTLVNSRAAGSIDILAEAPLVAADPQTPAELIHGVSADRLFIPSYCPSWTWWPAGAAAMAVDGGARHIGLLGIDLGSSDATDPSYQPLLALLELLATLPGVRSVDCGRGAPKSGWESCGLEDLVSARTTDGFVLDSQVRPHPLACWADEHQMLERVTGAVAGARELYQTHRASARSAWQPEALRAAYNEVLRWREQSWLRQALQERLGLVFLPTLWRLDAFTQGEPRSQALQLALGELCEQCDRLEAKLATAQPAAEAA